MRVYRNDWETYARKHLLASIIIILIYPIGLLLFFWVLPPKPPDRPIELFAWGLVYMSLLLSMVVFPLIYIYLHMYHRKIIETQYYRLVDDGFIYITPKFLKYSLNFEDIKIIICPNPKGSKWEEDTQFGTLFYKNNTRGATLDMKTSYRFLCHYLRGLQRNPNKFKGIILIGYAGNREYIWAAINAIKKSRKNPEVWDKYLEEYWATHNRYYWLNTPLERILEDLHCPYTLEELENPDEDEYVEIDESKLREDVC